MADFISETWRALQAELDSKTDLELMDMLEEGVLESLKDMAEGGDLEKFDRQFKRLKSIKGEIMNRENRQPAPMGAPCERCCKRPGTVVLELDCSRAEVGNMWRRVCGVCSLAMLRTSGTLEGAGATNLTTMEWVPIEIRVADLAQIPARPYWMDRNEEEPKADVSGQPEAQGAS